MNENQARFELHMGLEIANRDNTKADIASDTAEIERLEIELIEQLKRHAMYDNLKNYKAGVKRVAELIEIIKTNAIMHATFYYPDEPKRDAKFAETQAECRRLMSKAEAEIPFTVQLTTHKYIQEAAKKRRDLKRACNSLGRNITTLEYILESIENMTPDNY